MTLSPNDEGRRRFAICPLQLATFIAIPAVNGPRFPERMVKSQKEIQECLLTKEIALGVGQWIEVYLLLTQTQRGRTRFSEYVPTHCLIFGKTDEMSKIWQLHL